MAETIAETFGVSKDKVLADPRVLWIAREVGSDSLDLVERIMEIEENMDRGE